MNLAAPALVRLILNSICNYYVLKKNDDFLESIWGSITAFRAEKKLKSFSVSMTSPFSQKESTDQTRAYY